ncbi:protein-S-isoprenylcysteine methyltransferase [Lentzea sp. NBRC 105346]|uniref:methyltransferase family protein n=1 Tax=Lentzea sp. NBRC 105346 TaxID=3032205 RepID=UPI0024A464FD|nr:isoprenylcysteine carboxylmethyltransferase family protein [Lentzea sp. NBRC 105346]GLZ29813.1 protein-S-isoprenylcysteine methyltransferase [Lentzea sp. NBRC 105346]
MSTVALVRRVPLALFVVAVGACAIGLLRQANPLAVLVIGAYLLWLFAEARITVRTPTESAAEERTLAPYAAVRVATCAAAVLGPVPQWHAWQLVPALVFALGVLLRLRAIAVLGRFYSHHVVRHQDHEIVTTGPYRFVCHPAYTGMLLAHLGFVALFANPVSVVLVVALAAVLVWRIRVEEHVLLAVPGYPAYAEGRARLIPGVW